MLLIRTLFVCACLIAYHSNAKDINNGKVQPGKPQEISRIDALLNYGRNVNQEGCNCNDTGCDCPEGLDACCRSGFCCGEDYPICCPLVCCPAQYPICCNENQCCY